MERFELVRYHILSSIRAAMVQASGYEEEAERLRAQANLRLMIMSEEELQELARMLSFLPSRPTEVVYDEIKAAVKDHKRTAHEWVGSLGVEPYVTPIKN